METLLSKHQLNPINRDKLLTLFAWIIMLLISDLTDIILHHLSWQKPDWLFLGKIIVIFLFLLLCFVWKQIKPLWQFVSILFIFYLLLTFSRWFKNTEWWSGLFIGTKSSFTISYLEAYIRDFSIALGVIVALWLIKKHRTKFFFQRGAINAAVEPVSWLGVKKGESWKKFGLIIALVASAVVFIPTIFSIQPSLEMISNTIPLLPSVLLFSAINAFNEEIYFRVSILATLNELISKTHLLLISSVFFGLAHYLHGTPSGIIGFLLTGFLAYLLGKSILETKGVFWAWFIHFLADVIVFISIALLWYK